jgi:hypothetical protein
MSDIEFTQLRRLDMTLLLVFAELVRQRKMTIVAQRFGLTQSAISDSLKRLRDVFQDELFRRASNGLEPTDRALRLASKVSAILALSTEALSLDKTFDPGTKSRVIRVGALDCEVAMFAAPLIERYFGYFFTRGGPCPKEFRGGPHLGIEFVAHLKWILDESWDSDRRVVPAPPNGPKRPG